MQLSIIIVNYNVKYFLEQCLCSVLKACANIEAEVLVIDNHSTDGSREFFNNRFPQVTFIWENKNAGFAKANNKALAQATGKKVLFLNPDTIVPEDCFEKCLLFFEQQKNIGALGVRMLDGAGNFLPESKRGFPSFFTSFCKFTGLTNWFPSSKLFARYYLGHLPEMQNNTVDVLSGAFMMVDKQLLDTVGGFDEDYFMYAEDIDLSYRIQKTTCKATGKNYINYYFADTTIIHFKGESTNKNSVAYIHHFYGTMRLFVKKHYKAFSATLYVLLLKILIAFKKIQIKKPVQTNSTAPMQNLYILAGDALFNTINTSLSTHFSSVIKIENIQLAKKNNPLVLCEPSLSFAEIIHLVQQHKNQYPFFIYTANTNAIIGSNHKNLPGSFILLG